MRVAGAVFGVLLLLLGLVWIGQGLGYIKGSFMTGELFWFWVGLGCAVIGTALIALTLRKQPADR